MTQIKATYAEVRETVADNFAAVYMDAVEMAEKVGVAPSKPRVARKQNHRANAPSESIEDHYRVNCAVPFIDHIITSLDDKFDGLHTKIKIYFSVLMVILKIYFWL